MSGFIYTGDFYIGFYNESNEFTGFLPDILNVTSVSFTPPDTSTIVRSSFKRTSPGQALSTAPGLASTAPTMQMSTDEMIPEMIAMVLLGNSVEYTVSAGSATAEVVTIYHDRWTKLANVNLVDDGSFVLDDGDSTAYVEGTDFEVDYRTGMVRGLSDGAITDGQAGCEADYDFTAISGYEIWGQTVSQVKARIFADMVNRSDGARGELEVFEIAFKPSEAANLIDAESFLTAALNGEMVTRSGDSGPYRFRRITES